MANPKNTEAAAPKKSRTVKPKDLFMIYKGDVDVNAIQFTKDPLQVLELCSGTDGSKYAKVKLPAPTPRAKKA